MSSRVLIVDSGMKNLGGHNFSYTRAVQSHLEAKGHEVQVFAHKALAGNLAKDTGYRPTFTAGAYDFPMGFGARRDLAFVYAQSVIFADELERGLQKAGGDFSLIFCHTVGDHELVGWARMLGRRKLNGRLMILLRNTPGFRDCPRWRTTLHPYWRLKPASLARIHSRMDGRFTLLTDSEPLTEDYARVFRNRIVTLPIPISDQVLGASGLNGSGSLGSRYPLTGGDALRVGYMGDARSSKGFHLLPKLVDMLASNATRPLAFVVQCPPPASGYDDDQVAAGFKELEALSHLDNARVTLIPERLDEDEYAELLACLDVVLIPYRRHGYVEPTSGIFAEALALGKPVVVPSGTWMARELKRSGGGAVFEPGDPVSLAEAVAEVCSNFSGYVSKARSFAEDWAQFHNARNLVSVLSREAGLDAASAR